MTLDSATLNDLEVVSTSIAGGPTLLALVDRTRTRAGREHLRRRLMAPAGSVEAILDLQRAHQALAAHADAYRNVIHRVDPDAADAYLRSRWQLPSSRRGVIRYARLWRPAWHQQYLLDVREARARIMALIDAAEVLRNRFAATDARLLEDLGIRLGSQLDAPEARQLLRLGAGESLRALEAFDQFARDGARAVILALIDCLGVVEAMWSIAAATTEHGWSYPRPGSRLTAKGLFHPFLGDAAVRNDVDLGEEVRICFVTGPNMAGKSTFLKAVAAATLLAYCGCGVPAAAMEFQPSGTIFSSVQIVDDLSAGESFYLAEVRRMRALAVALHDHRSALAVIDEPFRGTNVHDAAEATLAVITRLAAVPGALVFVASHLAEVVPAITGNPRVRLLHFAADVTADQPRFDYQLRPGMSTQRLGMMLLRQEQVLELLERSSVSRAAQPA